MKLKPCLLPVSALAIAIAASIPVHAVETQKATGTLEEVTVTAQRRSERSLDVPISVTALSADQLGKGDVQTLADIMKLTPGVRFDELGANSQPTVRGVGTAVVVAGASSNVAIYTDGFYSPSMLAGDSELLNIASVQVLKGPQGTLFGRNSTGGAILVTTADPDSEEHSKFEASYGSYNAERYQFYTTGGPSDDLAFDMALLSRKGDGYIKNIATGDKNTGKYDNWAVRLGAKWDMTDSTSALLRFSRNNTNDPTAVNTGLYRENGVTQSMAAALGVPVATDPHEVSYDFDSQYYSSADAWQLTLTSDLEFATLKSFTQYRDESGTHHYDFDGSPIPIYHYKFTTEDKVFTQEFLLSSNSDGPLQWTTGLFYFDNETVYPRNQTSVGGAAFVPFGGSGVTTQSAAVFADITYALTDDLYLTVGARYNQDDIKDAFFIDNTTGGKVHAADTDDSHVTPRVALRYELDDNASVYASYTEGYKSGILNVAGGSLNGIEVDPEKIKAFEVGYKYSGDRMMLDLAAFSYDYQGLQVASYAQTDSIIRNAADSSVFGVEGQMRYALTDKLELNVGATYLDAEYDDFKESQLWVQCSNAVACGSSYGVFLPSYGDASGNEMLRSPELTATLGLSYETELADGQLVLSGNLYYTDDFYFDSSELFEQDSYELLSARAAWTDPTDSYTVAIFADNLTDEEYRSQVLPQFYGPLVTWGAPRTVGASVSFNF